MRKQGVFEEMDNKRADMNCWKRLKVFCFEGANRFHLSECSVCPDDVYFWPIAALSYLYFLGVEMMTDVESERELT